MIHLVKISLCESEGKCALFSTKQLMRTARGDIAVAMVNSATIYINDLLLFSGKFVLFKFLKNGVKTSLFF